MKTVIPSPQEDSILVADCLQGNRETFSVLVGRYQSLICALIYSRCGNVSLSEDLAQETFLAAWQSLSSLQDPSLFKSWLCQIARNVSANVARTESRRAHGHSSSIDLLAELPDVRPSPSVETMCREEEEVVWRALEQLPENYRLPLILFHREGESIAAVALALDVSEDAVKQRLVRGREMLRQEVNNVVEGALDRTKPGAKFTAGVVAAIGAVGVSTAKGAGLGAVAVNVTVAKGVVGAGSFFWMSILPLIGNYLLWRCIQKKARTPEERILLQRYVLIISLTDVLFAAWMFALIRFSPGLKPSITTLLVITSAVLFFVLRWGQTFFAFRKVGWIGPAVKAADGRNYRKGYAPGWQVRCPKCGLTVDAGAAGLIRIGAVGRSRRLGPCSRCNRFRWLIVERIKIEE
ncbi:MAG: polymerase sigma factor, sigma-70 family [Verrucomicrobiales bacterium]|nr:polymerase sigma factor, sigma-70 family [Verrucomicrobiales bacterium]